MKPDNKSKIKHERSISLEMPTDHLNFNHNFSTNTHLGTNPNQTNSTVLIASKLASLQNNNFLDDTIPNSTHISPNHNNIGRRNIATATLVNNIQSMGIIAQKTNYLKPQNNLKPCQFFEEDTKGKVLKFGDDIELLKEKELIENRQILEVDIYKEQETLEEMKIKLKDYEKTFKSQKLCISSRIKEIEKIFNNKKNLDDDSLQDQYNINNNSSSNRNNQLDYKDNNYEVLSSISSINSPSNTNNNNNISDTIQQLSGLDNHTLDTEHKDLMKKLNKVNENLIHDLKLLETLIIRDIENESIDLINLKGKIRSSEQGLQDINNEKASLLYKIYQCEEKYNQYREIKNMIAEDFYSHVELITECVAISEELDNQMESIKYKYHNCYESIIKDIELTDTLIKIEDTIKETEDYCSILNSESEEILGELKNLGDKASILVREIENLNEMEEIIRQDIICPDKSILKKFQDSGIINEMKNELETLLNFLNVFGIAENMTKTDIDTNLRWLTDYQGKLLNEIKTIICTKHDYENILRTYTQLQQGKGISYSSSSNLDLETHTNFKISNNNGIQNSKPIDILPNNTLSRENNKFLTGLQEEILEKKNLLEELVNQFEIDRKDYVEKMRKTYENSNLFEIIQQNSQQNFYEILKTMQNFKVENLLLSITCPKQELYHSLLSINKDLTQKLFNLENLNSTINDQQMIYNEKLNEIDECIKNLEEQQKAYTEMQELQATIQASYKDYMIKDSDKIYQSYLPDDNMYLKKIHFQYGRNCLTKLQVNDNSESINALNNANTVFLKKKAEIYEIKNTLVKMENLRTTNTLKLENEIKKNYNQMNKKVKEYEAMIEILSNELFDTFENERTISKNLEESMITFKLSLNSDTSVNIGINIKHERAINDILDNIQIHKIYVSRSICNIIDKILALKYKNIYDLEKLTPLQKTELVMTIKKLKNELNNLNGFDIKHMENYQNNIKNKENLIKTKQIQLNLLNKEIKGLRSFNEEYRDCIKENNNTANKDINDQKHKKKNSKSINRQSGELKKIKSKSRNSSQSNGKLIKEPLQYGRVTYDIKDNRSFDMSLENIMKSGRENSQERPGITADIGYSPLNSIFNSPSNLISPPAALGNAVNSLKLNTKSPENPSLQVSDSYQSLFPYRNSLLANENKSTPNSSNKFLTITDKSRLAKMVKEFENGLSIYKKFSCSSSIASKNENMTGMDQVTKAYGKRILKLNKTTKSIDILKISLPLSRFTIEHTYEWKMTKKLFIPQKTFDILKSYYAPILTKTNKGNVIKAQPQFDEQLILPFALDIQNKGRIELIATDANTVLIIYNILNGIIEEGGILKL